MDLPGRTALAQGRRGRGTRGGKNRPGAQATGSASSIELPTPPAAALNRTLPPARCREVARAAPPRRAGARR
eukprot:15342481-Alexandrium_andersonii.AAC.1